MSVTLTIMIGIPASGKSTYAKRLLEKDKNAVLISSDDLRTTLLNDVARQDKNNLIFAIAHQMAITALKSGSNVIMDATNVWENKRRAFVEAIKAEVADLYVKAVYCAIDHKDAIYNNKKRDRQVPEEAIAKIYKNADIPTKRDEYIDEIEYFTTGYILDTTLDDLLKPEVDYDMFINIMARNVQTFGRVINMPQDCPYHTLSVSRHIYAAFDYARKYMPEDIKSYHTHILYALAFHDIGKGVTKEFRKKKSMYANFIGHEKVSAQIFMAVAMTHSCIAENETIDSEFIAALIKEHGFPYANKDIEAYENALVEIERIYGTDFMKCLKFMRKCDIAGK